MSATSPSQTVGPFFKYALDHPTWSDLAADGALGERIRIVGRVLDGDGEPVPDAMLEIWQANAAGKYAHDEDTQDKPLDPNFRGFGRACTDDEGRFAFVTVLPGVVPDATGAPQAPHANLSVFARGLSIGDDAVRASLVASLEASAAGEPRTYRFNVVLQGANETAFLDV